MRKRISNLICVFLLITFGLCGCAPSESINEPRYQSSAFVEVEDGSCWKILYHKDTKVMYVMSHGSYSYGHFTVMVDSEGKPLLYEE